MTDTSVHSSEAERELLDEMGRFFKHLGAPRAAGQIFGFLMACDPPEQSANQISEAVGVSLASVSSNVRLLQQLGAIEPRHRRNDRKTFYRLRRDFWIEIAVAKMSAFQDLAAVGREVEASGGLARTDSVEEMIAFADFWKQELPRLVGRWRETRMKDAP